MKNIASFSINQDLSSNSIRIPTFSPEQELSFQERRRERINQLSGNYQKKESERVEAFPGYHETRKAIQKQGKNYFKKLTPTQVRIYNFVLHIKRVFGEIFIQQERIADELGITRRTVGRAMIVFEEKRILKRITTGYVTGRDGKEYTYKQHTRYQIPDFMFRTDIKCRLYSLFDALSHKMRDLYKPIALALLFVNTAVLYPKFSSPSEYVPVDNRYIYKNNSLTPRESNLYKRVIPSKLGREDVSSMSDVPISSLPSPQLSDLLRNHVTPLLKLTRKGQFFFAAFHDDALAHGLHGLPILGSKSPGGMPHGAVADEYDYRLFVNLCEYWSKREGLHIDYGKTDQLMRQYPCRDDMPMFFSHSSPLNHRQIVDSQREPEPSPYDRPPKTRPPYPSSSVSRSHYTPNNAPRSVPPSPKNIPILKTQAPPSPPRSIKRHTHTAIADNPMLNESFAALAETIKARSDKKDKQATIFNDMETS